MKSEVLRPADVAELVCVCPPVGRTQELVRRRLHEIGDSASGGECVYADGSDFAETKELRAEKFEGVIHLVLVCGLEDWLRGIECGELW